MIESAPYLSPKGMQRALVSWVGSDFECVALPDDRLMCSTPLFYVNGEGVVIWVAPHDRDLYEVTDYSTNLMIYATSDVVVRRHLFAAGAHAAQQHGVRWLDGRMSAFVRGRNVPEAIWDVAQASRDVSVGMSDWAQVSAKKPTLKTKERFIREIERKFEQAQIPLLHDVSVSGASGHGYTAALVVPEKQIIMEPLANPAQFTSVASLFTKFSDIGREGIFKTLTVVDDTDQGMPEDWERLLVGVSDIAPWSEHRKWIPLLAA